MYLGLLAGFGNFLFWALIYSSIIKRISINETGLSVGIYLALTGIAYFFALGTRKDFNLGFYAGVLYSFLLTIKIIPL